MRTRLPLTVLLLVFALMVGACSGDDGAETTTTGAGGETATTLAGGGGSGTGGGGDSGGSAAEPAETTTTAATDEGDDAGDGGDQQVPTFTIVSREPGDEGDTVVVLLDTESYGLLTDIDLQNVVAEVVEDFPPVYTAHVIDSEEVADLVLEDPADLDAEEKRLLDLHYLVVLEEGFKITFLGPWEESGTAILGS